MAQQSFDLIASSFEQFTDEVIEEMVDQTINEEKEWREFYAENKTHVLFVFHIPEEINSYQLLDLFMAFGAQKAIVMTHEKTGRSRGFGFVHFATRYQAQMAIHCMDGFVIGHKRLRVAFKKPAQSNSVDTDGSRSSHSTLDVNVNANAIAAAHDHDRDHHRQPHSNSNSDSYSYLNLNLNSNSNSNSKGNANVKCKNRSKSKQKGKGKVNGKGKENQQPPRLSRARCADHAKKS